MILILSTEIITVTLQSKQTGQVTSEFDGKTVPYFNVCQFRAEME